MNSLGLFGTLLVLAGIFAAGAVIAGLTFSSFRGRALSAKRAVPSSPASHPPSRANSLTDASVASSSTALQSAALEARIEELETAFTRMTARDKMRRVRAGLKRDEDEAANAEPNPYTDPVAWKTWKRIERSKEKAK